ncbi:DUF2759 domain-containing protein [Bacillus solimangrovi]|uniref:DUF2759 domain-containing protein n=1 Tax=Bacillus solimangrovi TaxID=1305675 RepID=A0A1E5LFP4_9BACI|nr:DUF2759 domain-containing protein [Bacillus solimangrovi]OEH92892.1 DUF2759 domain-containing protein [Bacillus solimangrovi]
MGLVIIFTLVTIVAAIGTLRSLARKNALAILFASGTTLVFGWFSVMTFIAILGGHGVPVPAH